MRGSIMAEHKWADVLRAIADGKAVQYKAHSQGNWRDAEIDQMEDRYDPFTFPNYEWRIKPEPKPDVVRYLWASPDSGWCTRVGNYTYPATTPPNLKIILDGETGKLKSAEVLP